MKSCARWARHSKRRNRIEIWGGIANINQSLHLSRPHYDSTLSYVWYDIWKASKPCDMSGRLPSKLCRSKKRGISSKLHQNAVVALSSLAVWLISECKTVYFRRNHITILHCQCQYIIEWVELHYSCFVNLNPHTRLLVLSLLVCLRIHRIWIVITAVFVNWNNDLGVVSALRYQMDFATCRAWPVLLTISLFWYLARLCAIVSENRRVFLKLRVLERKKEIQSLAWACWSTQEKDKAERQQWQIRVGL